MTQAWHKGAFVQKQIHLNIWCLDLLFLFLFCFFFFNGFFVFYGIQFVFFMEFFVQK